MTNGVEQLITVMPDYECRTNGGFTVVVNASIINSKVYHISVRHGHTQFRNQE